MEMLARLANLPGALPGACAQGLIWGIMAIGVYLTYRILDVADLTVDGSFGTGGAVCVTFTATTLSSMISETGMFLSESSRLRAETTPFRRLRSTT